MNIDDKKLYVNFRKKLIEENLISSNDKINIKKICGVTQYGMSIYHYVVTVSDKEEGYLIKTVKEKDNSYNIMHYIAELNKGFNSIRFPNVLTKPFIIQHKKYIITSYFNGLDLRTLLPTLLNEELLHISNILIEDLECIHSISNDRYSYGNKFCNTSYADIMYNKLRYQFNNNEELLKTICKTINIDKILLNAKNILFSATYSKPTLLHMDINPSNIILSTDGNVYLIDFELSRFGDLDYEWANLLIKTLHVYDERYKQYVLQPILDQKFMPLDNALKIDKYKIYLLYHSINSYIYYSSNNKYCPSSIIELINILIKQLT